MSTDQRYTLYGEEFKANPFPTYKAMRETEPVCRHPGITGENMMWFVTSHEHTDAVLRDHKRFVKRWETTLSPEEQAKLEPESELMQLLNNHMLNTDGADHTRLRSLVNKAFTVRMMEQQREKIQRIANSLLDTVQERGQMDLIDEYAFPLPIIVISALLGIPDQDRDRFRAWSNAFIAPATSEEEWNEAQRLLTEFIEYIGALFAERRRAPKDDLITGLVQAEDAGDRLSEAELYSMVILLITAGHETTVNLIGNGTLALLQNPEQLALLKNDPSLIGDAVEELLRFDGPVDRVTMRFAAEDVELGGQLIKKGDAINVAVTSANRDAARFADADRLDITRTDNKMHMAFGFGVHYCVGAPLARLEGQIALNTLIQRLPDLRLTVPVEELTWGTVPIIRGMVHMPVAWG